MYVQIFILRNIRQIITLTDKIAAASRTMKPYLLKRFLSGVCLPEIPIKFVRSALNSMLVCVKWCWCRIKLLANALTFTAELPLLKIKQD
jgi:hypothetical protein